MSQETRFMQWTKSLGVALLLKELNFRGIRVTRSAVYAWRRGTLPEAATALALVRISRPMKKENRLTLADVYEGAAK